MMSGTSKNYGSVAEYQNNYGMRNDHMNVNRQIQSGLSASSSRFKQFNSKSGVNSPLRYFEKDEEGLIKLKLRKNEPVGKEDQYCLSLQRKRLIHEEKKKIIEKQKNQ